MSHEITENDCIVSIREKPWHGIGDVLDQNILVADARQKYLTWSAYKTSLHAQLYKDDGSVVFDKVPNKFGIIRDDISKILGVVGGRYEIYQNSDMWDFIAVYSSVTGMAIETAGSLKGGQYTWVLLKGEEFEIVKGDPINKYFLFRNSFTGLVPVSTLSTNIRVVCNNTLNLALQTAKNIYNVRHVTGVVAQVSEVERAVSVQNKYQDHVKDALQLLASKELTEPKIKSILENHIFPFKEVPVSPLNAEVVPTILLKQKEALEKQRLLKIKRDRKVQQVLDLVETGAGADIKGVRGTAYGLLQAIIEWTDHDKIVKASIHEIKASRFENAMFTSTEFKTDALNVLLKAV